LINSDAAGYLLVDMPVKSVKQWSDRKKRVQICETKRTDKIV